LEIVALRDIIPGMKAADLKNLLERVQAWPEAAQEELAAVANEIESELRGQDYFATHEELQVIDAAMAAIDRGEIATKAEVEAAFAKFRRG
jgi:glutathione S-transferase